MEVDHIVCDCNITYENGAVVRTGFVTNLDDENVLEADPELGRRLNEANDARLKAMKKTVAKYEYPDDVITAAERAAAERWHLSDRERAVQAALG